MDNKNILVTGGYGFIGSNFINYLIDNYNNFNLINIDKCGIGSDRNNIRKENPGQTIEHLELDISRGLVNDCKINLPFDYCFNFAAESHVDRSITTPDLFIISNVLGNMKLLEDCNKMGVKRFIQVSTDEIYGSVKKPAKEAAKYNPSSVYSASKASAEMLANAYKTTYDMDIIITRCSNNFGPNQFEEKLIPKVIKNALEGKEIPVYDKGEQIREWTWVNDHITDLIFVAENAPKGEIYNVGSGYSISNIELVKEILKILDKSENLIKFIPNARLGHDFKYAIDTGKLAKLRDSKILYKVEITKEGFLDKLQKTIEYYERINGDI